MPIKVGLQYIEIWKDSLEKTVRQYEAEETPKGQIVFYGPSNFTRWSKKWEMIPLREALVGKSGAPCCVNRGFGSSCPEHQLQYYPRIIRPLAPKVLVYASYGNFGVYGYSIEEGWELVLSIPLELVEKLWGVKANSGTWFRANFYSCGDETPLPHYASWNPVETESPDFHRPEFFGNVIIE